MHRERNSPCLKHSARAWPSLHFSCLLLSPFPRKKSSTVLNRWMFSVCKSLPIRKFLLTASVSCTCASPRISAQIGASPISGLLILMARSTGRSPPAPLAIRLRAGLPTARASLISRTAMERASSTCAGWILAKAPSSPTWKTLPPAFPGLPTGSRLHSVHSSRRRLRKLPHFPRRQKARSGLIRRRFMKT